MKKFLFILLISASVICLLTGCINKTERQNLTMNNQELTIEESDEILSKIDWLPLGTIVSLDGSEQKAMIIGRVQKDINNPDVQFEYTAVLYPQGLVNPKENYMFNLSQVKRIHFLGFSNEENEAFEKQMNQYIEENNIVYD